MAKLKPCPICGGAAVLKSRKARKGYEVAIQCNEGCVLCMTTIAYDTEEEAIKTIIKRWNTRTSKKWTKVLPTFVSVAERSKK